MSPLVATKFLMWPSVENACSPLLQIMVLYMAIAPNKAHYCCRNMGVGRIFSRGGELRNFSRKAKKIFLKMAKSVEISFFLFETKRSTIFAKKVLGKYQNENPRGP